MALTTTQQQDIIRYTVGIFGAAPGGYMNELSEFVMAGNSTSDMAKALANSTAFKNLSFAYSSASTDSQFVDAYASNLLCSSVSSDVLALVKTWMTNKLTTMSRGEMMVAAIDALNGVSDTDADLGNAKAQLDNRVSVATTYTITNSGTSTDLSTLQSKISTVTWDDATVTAADTSNSSSAGTTYTLTSAIDSITGTAGNDTIIGDNATASAADQVSGGAGTDTIKLYGNAAKPVLSGVEVVYLNGNTAGFDVSTNTDVTTLQLDDATTAQTYTIANGQAVSVANMAATEVIDFAGNTVTALSVGVNGLGTNSGANDVQIDFNSTAQTSVSFTSSTKKSYVELLNTGAKIATVNIAGDTEFLLTSALTTVTTIDASTATGKVTIAGVGASNLTYTGGSGADKVVMGATITAADVLTGGDGTDTLSVSDADTVDTTAEVVGITGFETFEAAADDATTYNMAIIGAKNTITGLVLSGTGGGATTTVSNINAATVGNITINGDASATNVLTGADFVSGGTSDTATITLDNSVLKAADGVDVTALTFANLDVLNLVSKGSGSTAATVASNNGNSIGTLTVADCEKITITGDETVSLVTAATSVPTEIDASALTNGAAVSVNTSASSITSILVKGTSKDDTINISANGTTGTIYTGGGTDALTVDTGQASTLVFTGTTSTATDLKGAVITIATAVAAGDLIFNLTSAMEGVLKIGNSLCSALSANANVSTTGLSATDSIYYSEAGGNSIIQIDLDGDGTYNAGNDMQITINGGAGTLANLTYNAANDYFITA